MPQRADAYPLTGISHLSPPNAPGAVSPSSIARNAAATEPYPQRGNPFSFEGSSGAETMERNAASMELIPMPTGAEAALRSLEESKTDRPRAPSVADGVPPAANRSADRSGGNRVPPGTDAGVSRRGATINPLPLPLRAPDPNFDPQRPFYGDQSGELVVAPSRPMPAELTAAQAELAPRALTGNPAPLLPSQSGQVPSLATSRPPTLTNAGASGNALPAFGAPGYPGAPNSSGYASGYAGSSGSMPATSASIVASMPGPADVIPPRDMREPNIQLQPSRRTVAIGAFIAIAVVAFTTALAIRSCHEQHTATNATTSGSADATGSGSADTGSATKPRPTVEPITE